MNVEKTADRLRVGLIARLYELSRGGVSIETFDSDLQSVARLAPSEFTVALAQLCRYYWSWADTAGTYCRDLATQSTYTHDWIVENSRALRAAVARLPAAQRAELPEQYRETGS